MAIGLLNGLLGVKMDWLTFIANIVDSVVWPGVVVFAIWRFHDKIGELLLRLIRFKHNNTEREFSEGIRGLEDSAGGPEKLAPPPDANELLKKQFDDMAILAQLSPRAAIMEAWLKVESAAARAAVRAYPELEEKQLRGPAQPLRLLEGKVLSKDETKQISELRRLRNLVAHNEKFDLEGHPVEAYIDIALTMANRLDTHDS